MAEMPTFRFNVQGVAQPQGSARAFMPRGKMRYPIVTSDNPQLKKWRKAVAAMAEIARGNRPTITGPIDLHVEFVFARPKSHLCKGGELTKKAPRFHTGRPDLDKLIRAIGDALTGVLYADDSQIDRIVASKRYGDGDYVRVAVWLAAWGADPMISFP